MMPVSYKEITIETWQEWQKGKLEHLIIAPLSSQSSANVNQIRSCSINKLLEPPVNKINKLELKMKQNKK